MLGSMFVSGGLFQIILACILWKIPATQTYQGAKETALLEHQRWAAEKFHGHSIGILNQT